MQVGPRPYLGLRRFRKEGERRRDLQEWQPVGCRGWGWTGCKRLFMCDAQLLRKLSIYTRVGTKAGTKAGG